MAPAIGSHEHAACDVHPANTSWPVVQTRARHLRSHEHATSDEAATERGRFVEQQRLFSDREVERRIAAIQAIRDAEIENLLSRLRLLRSCLSKEQQKSPALQFFRENFPNLCVVRNESDGIFELGWKDKVGNLSLNHVTGRNVLSSPATASTLPASGLGLEFSTESFKMNFVEAASLQFPGSLCL